MGFYIFPGSIPTRDHMAVVHEGEVFTESAFRGGYQVILTKYLKII